MKKQWEDKVKEKLDSYNSRRAEIDKSLRDILNNLSRSPYNIGVDKELIDEQNLVWKVQIGKQVFTITEEEIAKEQIITTRDEYGGTIETGEKRDVKKALQNIILNKLKSF